ncbi:hypothetical protein BAU18_002184 [Enterococcus diestrammenae]|uniref:Uncharacterized protein n=1 Tax=Enterococcus diestrammenae TaxID=1155073 RepID=A0ABV0F3I9_9ENTE|nr:hypothetical protein BAU18_11765 [Enterococcus diestrammenae]
MLKKINPDILHLHSSKAGAIGRVASIGFTNVKVIFTAHGWSFTDGVSKKKAAIYVRIERVLSRFTDKIICVSKYDYKIAQNSKIFSKTDGIVIYNGVFSSEDYKLPSQYSNDYSKLKPNFIMIARFSEVQKRQDLLVEAAKVLVEEGEKNFQITFIGDGEKYEDTKKLVTKYNLTSHVIFLGFKNDPEKYFKKGSILTLISDYEGLPISIIEGMCAGCPILATDVGGVDELVRDGLNGYLTSLNPVEIAKAMRTMISLSPSEYAMLASNSRYYYESDFTIKKFIDATLQCYQDCLN